MTFHTPLHSTHSITSLSHRIDITHSHTHATSCTPKTSSIDSIHSHHSIPSHKHTQPSSFHFISIHQLNQSTNSKIQLQLLYHHHFNFQVWHFPSIISLPFSFILFSTSRLKNTSNLFPQFPPNRWDTTSFIIKIPIFKDTVHFSPQHSIQSFHLYIPIDSFPSILFNHSYITKIHSHYYHSFAQKHNSSILILQFSIQTSHTSTNINIHFVLLFNIP